MAMSDAEAKGQHTQDVKDDSMLNIIPDVCKHFSYNSFDFKPNLHSLSCPSYRGDANDSVLCMSLPQASGVAHDIWKMTFYTPEPVSMVLREAQQAGYGAMTTSNRLVVRSPYTTAETNAENVSKTHPTHVLVSFPSYK